MLGIGTALRAWRGPRRTTAANAVITGAGSGIGRAFALELARRGGHVVCADIDPERAAETVTLIQELPTGAGYAVPCDVSDRAAVELLAEKAQQIFDGAPTLVINNAGVGIGGKPVGDIGFDDWDWALGINLWGSSTDVRCSPRSCGRPATVASSTSPPPPASPPLPRWPPTTCPRRA